MRNRSLISIFLMLVLNTYCQVPSIEVLPEEGVVEIEAALRINEIMQSNIDCIMDDLNEFPDSWVELYNSGNQEVLLDSYSIGLSDNAVESYRLPSLTVAPHTYVIVYGDKESQGSHTNFRIDSGKGEVFLFYDGKICAHQFLKKQPAANIAYGRRTEESDEWGYQLIPSPGKNNCGELAKGVLSTPIVNTGNAVLIGGGTSVSIEIPSDSPEGTQIRYTLDGSEPTEESLLYDGPIPVSQSSVVRAKLFCNGYLSARSITQSVIISPRKHKLPIVSMVTDNNYLYSDSIGIYSNHVYRNDTVNFKYNWRRPVNIEYFDVEGREVINQLCESRIHGGGSRQYPLKSMVCYANKRFGEKRFKYVFFPNQRPGIKEQKSFILRNSGSDFVYLYMRDAIIQGLVQRYMKLDYQAYQPVAFYINGEYKGLMYLMERSTEDNIETNYGIEDFDMIENWVELKRGDWSNFNEFEAFYSEEGHTYEEYEQWMDVDEFCDYMIMELFFANRDFPNNNIIMWRSRTAGGKWRWIVKDMDFGLGLETSYDFNIFPWLYGDVDAPNEPYRRLPDKKFTILFQNLMKNNQFRDMFVERSYAYVKDFMNAKGVHEVWDALWEMIGDEYKAHRALYENWGWTWRSHEWVWDAVEEWIQNRPAYYLRHMEEFYGLKSSGVASTSNTDNGDWDVNGRNLTITGNSNTYYCVSDTRGYLRSEGIISNGYQTIINLSKGLYLLTMNGITHKFAIIE